MEIGFRDPLWLAYWCISFIAGYDGVCVIKKDASRITRFSAGFHIWFLYVWGLWGWEDSETLRGAAWWLDEAGHALYSFVFALLAYLVAQTRSRKFYDPDERWELDALVIALTFLWAGLFWEIGEFIRDRFGSTLDWRTVAQIDSVDTMLDLIITAVCASLAAGTRRMWDRYGVSTDYKRLDRIDAMEILRRKERIRKRHAGNIKDLRRRIRAPRELIRFLRKA